MMERLELLRSKFDSEVVESVQKHGYAIVDDYLVEEWAQSLLADCKRMQAEGCIKQHRFQFGEQLYDKPNIFEVDLHDSKQRDKSDELSFIFDHSGPYLTSILSETFPHLKICTSPSAIKMQYNAGSGGCFPYHYDNPGPPSKRQLTCILYLNESWKDGDGGELVLWPFLSDALTIAPKMNRIVLFRSDLILHRVLPAVRERFCLTVWCDGYAVNSAEDVNLTRDKLQFTSYEEAADFFRNSPLQRVLSRAVYDDEYEESLRQCVGGTPAEGIMVKQHKHSVAAIESKLGPLIEEFRRRKGQEERETY